MNNLSVCIVDDHQLFREGLKLLLGNLSFINQIKEAANGLEFLELVNAEPNFDIVFMDIEMPKMNGIDATRTALASQPQLNIIALSMYSDEAYYSKMIEVGAKGFIFKNSGIQEVELAINHLMEGKNYFSQEILNALLQSAYKKKHPSRSSELSEREEEVLYQICKGHSNAEIADLLCISKRTVDKHRENILLKTNSKNTAGLVMFAIKTGLVEV